MGVKDMPAFRQYIEDMKYYTAPTKFSLHTAYAEVRPYQGWMKQYSTRIGTTNVDSPDTQPTGLPELPALKYQAAA